MISRQSKRQSKSKSKEKRKKRSKVLRIENESYLFQDPQQQSKRLTSTNVAESYGSTSKVQVTTQKSGGFQNLTVYANTAAGFNKSLSWYLQQRKVLVVARTIQ
jgi:hypothetical protein